MIACVVGSCNGMPKTSLPSPSDDKMVNPSTANAGHFEDTSKLDLKQRLYEVGRYTRFVSIMKWALPAIAICLLALAFMLPGFVEQPDAISFNYKDVAVKDQKLTMRNPKFLSSDKGNQSYVVTAESATQVDLKTKKITLVKLQADITLKNGQWLSLTAPMGLLDPDAEILDLEGGIEIFSDNGNQIYADNAHVNLKTHVIESPQGLKAHGPMGELVADKLVADQLNGTIRFEGNVKMTLYP